jgi:hypothetical protein
VFPKKSSLDGSGDFTNISRIALDIKNKGMIDSIDLALSFFLGNWKVWYISIRHS